MTFPGDINIIQVTSLVNNSFNTTMRSQSGTVASYDDKPSIKIDIMSDYNNPTHLSSNDTQNINTTGVAKFYVVITNNGFVPLDSIETTSLLAPSCNRTVAQLATLIRAQGNRDAVLDSTGGESIAYSCQTTGVTYPDNTNTISVRSVTVNTKNSDIPVFYALDKNYNTKSVDTLGVPYSSLLMTSIPDDRFLSGNKPVFYTQRDSIFSCSDEQQCEWYCPTDKPYYCKFNNTCTTSASECVPSCQQ